MASRSSWLACGRPGCDFFGTRNHLFDHLRTHTGERPFPCTWPGCTYLAAQPKTLLVHRRRHTGERPYICTAPGCASAFTDPRILAAHVARGDHGAPMRTHARAAGAAAAKGAVAAARLRGGAPAPGAPAFSAIATIGGALLCVAVARGPKREGKAAIRGWTIDAVTGNISRRAA